MRNEGAMLFIILAVLIVFLIGFPLLEDVVMPDEIG
tara:strand:- start:205 stop:312 length:108 start_codon:yes stop_codon:yes gene_type:complete